MANMLVICMLISNKLRDPEIKCYQFSHPREKKSNLGIFVSAIIFWLFSKKSSVSKMKTSVLYSDQS